MDLEKIETLAKKRIAEAKADYDTRLKYPDEYALNLAYGRRTKGAGAAAWRSNVFLPTIPAAIAQFKPRLIDGLIGPDGTDFFDLEADSEMDENDISLKMSADIIKALQNKDYGDEGMFYAVQEQIENNCLVFGRGYSIIGWEDYSETHSYYRSEGEKLFKETITKRINRPTRRCPNSTDVWPDPSASNWKNKNYVVERQYLTLSQLKKDVKKWNVKARFNDVLKMVEDEIKADVQNKVSNQDGSNIQSPASSDPLQTCFIVYGKGEITMMWRGYCIKYEGQENNGEPFAHGNIPVYSYQYKPDVYRYAPKGLPLILCDINEAQNTAINAMMDSYIITVNPMFKQRRTSFLDTQDKTWEPGKVMMMDDLKDFEQMELLKTNVETWPLLEKLAGIANQASGSMDFMNAPTGTGNTVKTFGGQRLLKQESNIQLAEVIKHQKETALKPELQDTLMNYYQFLDKETVEERLGKSKATVLNYTKDFKIAWDAKWRYKISANISMADKQSKLDDIQQFVQMLLPLQQAIQGGALINPEPIVKQMLDTLGVDKTILDVKPQMQLPPAQPQTGQPAPQGPQGAVASNPATVAVPNTANPGMPPKSPPTAALTPEQIQQIPMIAQKLGIEPEKLMAELQSGIIPGGFETLLHISKQPPEVIAKYMAAAQQGAQKQV